MANETNSPAPDTQATRRLKFGLNVAVAVAAAIVLVVLLNWIAYRQYIRFDLTATRQHSLSRQTEKVLGNLNTDYRIVSLFRVMGPRLEQVRDLIDEYGRYSPRLDVQHIDPDLGVARRDQFHRQLRERFDDSLQPIEDAIEQGRETLRSLTSEMAQLMEPLDEAVENAELPDGQVKQFIESVRAAIVNTQTQVQRLQEGIDLALEQPLPDLGAVKSEVQRLLQELDEGLFAVAVERFERIADRNDVPAKVRDRLLGAAEHLRDLRNQARTALQTVRDVPLVDDYEQLIAEITNTESIVVLSPDQIRVIDVRDMFREPDPRVVQQTGERELQFLGEERLTGALVSMSVEQPAMIVFVITGQRPAIGPGGEYEHVAQRLRAANFRVEQWNPGGQMSAMGQQMPPQPPPQAQPGQQTIWIVPPFAPGQDPMAMMSASGKKQQVGEILEDALETGDAAMFMLSVSPGSQFGEEDPLVGILHDWGINPQLDRVVLQQVQLPNRQTRASAQFQVDQWPDHLPITQALAGMQAVFLQGSPLIAAGAEGVALSSLVELRGQQVWAEDDFQSLQAPGGAQFDPGASADAFTIGMAAERDDARLVVVADPAWATDALTTYGPMGPGSAELFGAAFPGNSELFVNSVYWLAGLDQLIAASPRTQDIRRIGPMTDTAMYGYRTVLLAGLPLAITAAGLGVWFIRRRS